uniref:ethanolamine kinase n=1 Tax=Amphilophus citrinellus TaxID=61819 RepID=A0A3Q0TEI9_AMPCI
MASYIHVPDEAPVVPKIDVTVEENDYRPGALKLMEELRPSWRPSEIKMKFFTDGITNKLLGCYVGAAMQDVVLVRIYGNKTELLIDRENEVKSFRVLHAHRCAPRLYCTFNNGLCYEFLQGTALEPEHIRSQPVFSIYLSPSFCYLANSCPSDILLLGFLQCLLLHSSFNGWPCCK